MAKRLRIGRRSAAWATLAAGLLAAAGCGFADAGDGTKTLGVVGRLRCGYPQLVTQAEFDITDERGAVPLANVTLRDADTGESIELPAATTTGHYAATWPGYHRRVRADVWRGKDGMHFQIEGPSPHVLLAPAAGSFVKAGHAMDVRWRAPDGMRADRVDVHVDPEGGQAGAPAAETTGGTVSRDAGRAHLRLEDVAGGPHVVQVARTSVLSPSGATDGSTVESTYAVETAFFRR